MKTGNTKSLIVLVFLAILTLANFTQAETSATISPEKENKHQFSVRFSNLTGYGVAYQNRFAKNTYARITGWFKYYEYIKGPAAAPLITKSDITYNFGLDLQQNIISRKQYRVYGFLGGGYAIKEKMEYDSSNPDVGYDNVKCTIYTAGVGSGFEYFFNKHLSTDMGVCYKFDYNEQVVQEELTKETGLGVIVGINLNF